MSLPLTPTRSDRGTRSNGRSSAISILNPGPLGFGVGLEK